MPHNTLPLECWELVIDSCSEDTWPLAGSRRTTYSTLWSCALTCKVFHPRSRLNLLRYVELDTEAQVDLLIRTLTQQPSLAELVMGVLRRPPSVWSSVPNVYVPLARSPLPSLLRNCQSLAFPLSSSLHHANYIHALASFSHITRLAVFISGHTISTLLHVIWSYPDIGELYLEFSSSTNWKTISEGYERRMSEMRPASSCRNLKILSLNEPPTKFPPGVFGDSVSYLALNGLTETHNDKSYWSFLSGFLCLQTLDLSFVSRRCSVPSRSELEANEVRKHSVIYACLWNARAYATLRSVKPWTGTNAYVPSSAGKEPSTLNDDGSFYFVIPRLEALDLLFGTHMRELLRRFPRLDEYSVELYDSLDRERWWIDEIKKRMPDLLHAIHLRMEPFGRTESPASDPSLGGWLEDILPASSIMASPAKGDEVVEEPNSERGNEV